MTDEAHAYLQTLTETANRCAFAYLGYRDSCVLTSYALTDVLCKAGYDARPLRVEAKVFPRARKDGVILGWGGDGTRRKAAAPGKWKGHLAVAVGCEWLLDATLDQANQPEWIIKVSPLVLKLPTEFWDLSLPFHKRGVQAEGQGIETRHYLYPHQRGFAHAGDARPSHWRPLADAIRTRLEAMAIYRQRREQEQCANA